MGHSAKLDRKVPNAGSQHEFPTQGSKHKVVPAVDAARKIVGAKPCEHLSGTFVVGTRSANLVISKTTLL
jgi:hypothetical protein